MKNPYYAFWADAIIRSQKAHPERDSKWAMLIVFSSLFSYNICTFIPWMGYFKLVTIPILELNISSARSMNAFLAYSIEFVLPFFVLNYYLIYYKNKYVKLIEVHTVGKTNYIMIYAILTVVFFIISTVLYAYITDPLFIEKILGNA